MRVNLEGSWTLPFESIEHELCLSEALKLDVISWAGSDYMTPRYNLDNRLEVIFPFRRLTVRLSEHCRKWVGLIHR